MSPSSILIFFIGVSGCFTLLIAAVNYYVQTQQNALNRRVQELQEQSGGESGPLLGGDIWDSLLRATYGTLFGRGWFRQKELELMRGGFRGASAVKTYGILSLVFAVGLFASAVVLLQDQEL